MKLQVNVQDTVLKPVNTVFEAIINPDHLSGYFISRASKAIETPEKITWFFDDVGAELSVQIKKIDTDRQIIFEWEASGKMAIVNILLEPKDQHSTLIKISEIGWEMNEEGIQSLLQQTQGWTDFICSMKAYLYTGINLRNGVIKMI